MILLADDDRDFLLRRAREVVIDLEQFSTVLAVERGDALRADNKEGIEHFGYVDGRSQPIYFEPDLKDEGTANNWEPGAGLKIVLVPDAPLIGQGPKSKKQHWPKNWGAAETADFGFSDFVKLDRFSGFVTLKGGEYFFAPSIPFLQSLGGDQ